jgi:hypothetical protein
LVAEIPAELRLGRAGHAFDHLGGIGEQADAAAASGATIIYTGGLGEAGYSGLPPQAEFAKLLNAGRDYSYRSKKQGIELSIGYLCATSIVKLDTFDKNWTKDFRDQFKTRPAEWRQQDRRGHPLASWYGGDYAPACMNNPDWRAYERAMVRYQLETGHDGVFFDNPTVHPQGCYCWSCMNGFAAQLEAAGIPVPSPSSVTDVEQVEAIRRLADAHPQEFLKFRGATARDFLADMREFARSVNPRALVTCNNSLNSPDVLFSQARTYGYNIFEMSKAEDFVVVEDMVSQPRTEPDGRVIEYGPTYKQLQAISHSKPIVAVTIAGGDYHTPANLMRLAMAEAAANDASYLSWPTWPEAERTKMIAAVRPQADFLRRNEAILNDTPLRADVLLFLPFRRWVENETCAASNIAAALTKANVQYRVICEDDLNALAKEEVHTTLVIESRSVLTPEEQASIAALEKQGVLDVVTADGANWLDDFIHSTHIQGSPLVRAVVHEQPHRTIVHLYNLNIQRLTSFEDKVTPAIDVGLSVRVPLKPEKVSIQTADPSGTSGQLTAIISQQGDDIIVSTTVPRLEISAIVTIEQ